MIRTTALQTQHLMHVLELLYCYRNCHWMGKKSQLGDTRLQPWWNLLLPSRAALSRGQHGFPRTDLKSTRWTWLPLKSLSLFNIQYIVVYPAHIQEQATKTARKETLTSSTPRTLCWHERRSISRPSLLIPQKWDDVLTSGDLPAALWSKLPSAESPFSCHCSKAIL